MVLTADTTEITRRKCIEAGATRTLLKPIKKLTLLDTLADVTRLSQLRSDAEHTVASDPLPLSVASESTSGESLRAACLRVLVVDDSAVNRTVAAHAVRKVLGLVSEGSVLCAESGQQAVQLLTEPQSHFDLVLLDVKLHDLDGPEVARAVRRSHAEQRRQRQTRIIGVTGFDEQWLHRACLEAGMDAVVVKPLREEHLRDVLNRVSIRPSQVAQENGSGAGAAVPPGSCTSVAAPPSSSSSASSSTSASPFASLARSDLLSHLMLFDNSSLSDFDDQFRVQLLEQWKHTSEVQLRQLKELMQLYSTQNWQHVAAVAHSLKGAAAQVGAARFAQLAEQLETLARSTAQGMVNTLEQLSQLLAATAERIEHCAATSPHDKRAARAESPPTNAGDREAKKRCLPRQ